MYIFNRPVFYLKQNISETVFCFRFQKVLTQLVLVSLAQLSKIHLKTGTECSARNVVVVF
jgi:hypothetical protein